MRDELFSELIEVKDGVIRAIDAPRVIAESEAAGEARRLEAKLIGVVGNDRVMPHARGVSRVVDVLIAEGEVDIAAWEPVYGRLAEAQVRWEAAHGRPLTAAG
jgi:hypothetical protein